MSEGGAKTPNMSEKESSQVESKPDQDATSSKKAPSSKPGSAKSKPGSAKSSRAGSARAKSKSQMSTASGAAASGAGSGAGSGSPPPKPKKKKEKKMPPPPDFDVLPDGCKPVFMSGQSQEIFQCIGDDQVTEEMPYKILLKEDIKKDFFNRAAISDLNPFKAQINAYPEEELLIVYDAEYKFGQNFFICLTPEAKKGLLSRTSGGDSQAGDEDGESRGEEEDEEEEEEEDTTVYVYVPPESKPWVSLGSEKEIDDCAVGTTHKKITMSVKRKRANFGAPVQFEDLNVADSKHAYMECTAYEDKTYSMQRLELDSSCQAVPELVDSVSQTDWKYPRNANTQYEPRLFSETEKEAIMQKDDLLKFVKSVIPRFELAMQQNGIMDIFFDDWMGLADNDSTFGTKADNHLKEYQSFTDLQFSKDRTVTCIEWHPVLKGVIAVSVAERLSFDDRIDYAARVIMTPSLILIWSFTDPIHPQLILEAPDDIYCFKFCPTDPNIIVGGCINGQVVLWDIASYTDRLKTQRGSNKKKNNLATLPGFEDESALDTPIVRYCGVSSIEHSHRAAITDIQWVPDHMELSRLGIPQENRSGSCVQVMSAATDHSILVWDIRPPKAAHNQPEKKKDNIHNPMGVATTFKHLDLTWKPQLKVNLLKSEPGGDHSPTKFTIHEIQGEKSILSSGSDGKMEKRESVAGFGGGGFGKPGSAAKKTLSTINTHFYAGTEDGEIVYLDWMPQKDQDSGKIQTPKPDYYHCLHDGPIVTLQRSPFFRDVILCVGGWTFTVWKEGVTTGPIMQSSASNKRLTCGFWSPTRPGVFFISKNDGCIDVWDILDRTHEPSMTQSVSSAAITCIFPYQVTAKQHLLAVGDMTGTLHILEIPWSLRQATPNEANGVANYFEREVKRRAFIMQRWDFREKEKMQIENEKKNSAGIAPNVSLTEEEIEQRQKMEFAAYLEEEAHFLRDLGLLKEGETQEELQVVE